MCFGAFLPARHVGRGFLRKRRMKEIGFLRYTATELGADGVPTRLDPATSEGSVWDEDGEIGRLDNEEWLVQRCVQFEADGYATIKMYFDHKPTAKEIEKAEAIREFEGGPEEVWYVWDERTDDQIPVHWLDADGDICRKVQIMRELGGGLYYGCKGNARTAGGDSATVLATIFDSHSIITDVGEGNK